MNANVKPWTSHQYRLPAAAAALLVSILLLGSVIGLFDSVHSIEAGVSTAVAQQQAAVPHS